MAITAATQGWSRDMWLWFGLGVTSFVTARIIARQLSEVVRLNEIHVYDDDDPPPPTPTPPTTGSGIEELPVNTYMQDQVRQQQQFLLQQTRASTSARTRIGRIKRGKTKHHQQPEDRIPIEVLSELAFCSSYDIREATNKIIAERWAQSERCKEALFTDLKSESALRREYGEHLLETLRDYNVDPAPPTPPPGENLTMDEFMAWEADADGNHLQTLEEVLEEALLHPTSINGAENPYNRTTITSVDPETARIQNRVVVDLADLNGEVGSSPPRNRAEEEELSEQDTFHELERQGNIHAAWPFSVSSDADDEEDSNATIPEIAQLLPQPRPSHDQSPEETERRRGRREAVVYGVESDDGEAQMLRVVRPGADPLDVHFRGSASSRRRRIGTSSNNNEQDEEDHL